MLSRLINHANVFFMATKTDITFPIFLEKAKFFVNLPPIGLNGADLYTWIWWNLWTSKNQLIFANRAFSEIETINKAMFDAKAWQEVLGKRPRPHGTSSQRSLTT